MKPRFNLSTRGLLVAIVLAAVLARVATAFILGDNAAPISGAYDQESYDALAQRVVAGKGFTFPIQWYPFTPPNQPTAHWSYLYTLYLAGVYAVVGHHPLAARLLQTLVSALGIWFIYRIGRRLFGVWAGLAAALLTAGYAYLIFFNAALMTQTFYIIAVLAAIDCALALVEKPTRRGWVGLGLAIGIGTLTRQTLFLFAPFLIAWIVWKIRAQVQWGNVLIAPAIIGLLILPFTIYNYFTFHDFLLLNSNSGFWFYSSNHPHHGTSFDPSYVAPIPEHLRGLSEPAEDRALLREGLGFIVAEPARFLLLSLNRTKDYFWFMPSEQSSVISNLARLLSFPLYIPFFLYGLFLSRRYWQACVPLYLYVLFDTSLCLISWAAPRYRLPSDAVMMAFAGLAMVDLATRLKIGTRAAGILKIDR